MALAVPVRENRAILRCLLARTNERVCVQNLRDFPQTKLDSEINASFLLNELGDPRFFVLVFAKNSPLKTTFEEGKKFDSRT